MTGGGRGVGVMLDCRRVVCRVVIREEGVVVADLAPDTDGERTAALFVEAVTSLVPAVVPFPPSTAPDLNFEVPFP